MSPNALIRLAQQIEDAIVVRTRSIDDLRVVAQPAGVTLSGRCPTFYAKQLAQEAAKAHSSAVSNHIEVV